MNNKWFGEFRTMKRSSLLSIQYWKWCFLNIWCLIDVLLFPVLFVLFYIIHICRNKARKKRGNLLQGVVCIYSRVLISSVSQFCTYSFETIIMVKFLRHLRSLGKSQKFSPTIPRIMVCAYKIQVRTFWEVHGTYPELNSRDILRAFKEFYF